MHKPEAEDWKKALMFLLDARWIHLHYHPTDKGLHQSANHKAKTCYQTALFNSYSSINEAKSHKINKTDDDINYHIHSSALLLLREMLRYELISVIDNGQGATHRYTVVVSAKGLETALKLQEHADNTSRFEQQKNISKELKRNSDRSVTTARWALVLSVVLVSIGVYRIHQLEQKILSHTTMETRINSLDAEVTRLNTNNAEVAVLKGRIDTLEKEKKERLDVAKVSKQPLPTSKKSP